MALNIHTIALNIHTMALNIHTMPLSIRTTALNIHTSPPPCSPGAAPARPTRTAGSWARPTPAPCPPPRPPPLYRPPPRATGRCTCGPTTHPLEKVRAPNQTKCKTKNQIKRKLKNGKRLTKKEGSGVLVRYSCKPKPPTRRLRSFSSFRAPARRVQPSARRRHVALARIRQLAGRERHHHHVRDAQPRQRDPARERRARPEEHARRDGRRVQRPEQGGGVPPLQLGRGGQVPGEQRRGLPRAGPLRGLSVGEPPRPPRV
eukprot:1111629-Prorocentrum_minimum.AAC.1